MEHAHNFKKDRQNILATKIAIDHLNEIPDKIFLQKIKKNTENK